LGLFCFVLSGAKAYGPEEKWILASPVFVISAPLFALATGPCLTLILRQAKLAFACMLVLAASSVVGGSLAASAFAMGSPEAKMYAASVIFFLLAMAGSLLGARDYLGHQDYNPLDRALDINAKTIQTKSTTSRNHTALTSLVRKEITLQLHSFLLIAAALFVGWVFPYQTDPGAPLGVVLCLLILVSPILIGMTSACEEQRLAGWEQSFVLPVSRRFVCVVKLLSNFLLAWAIIATMLFVYRRLGLANDFERIPFKRSSTRVA